MKTIEIKAADGYLNLAQRDFIDYLKNHKFRIFPKLIKVRIAYCLAPILVWIKSSLTTKYIISEEAKRAYCNGDEKMYNELSDFNSNENFRYYKNNSNRSTSCLNYPKNKIQF